MVFSVDFRVMIDLEGPLSWSALSLIGEVHIGARALLDIRKFDMVWLYSSRISQWGEGGYFNRSDDFYLPSLRLEGGWGSAPCMSNSILTSSVRNLFLYEPPGSLIICTDLSSCSRSCWLLTVLKLTLANKIFNKFFRIFIYLFLHCRILKQ
jgi:hypothetical protein